MTQNELEKIIFSKDNNEALCKFKELEKLCDTSKELYYFFDVYLNAILSTNACTRGRGFKLILENAKWDTENKINSNWQKILTVLSDENATVVRQCIPLLSNIGIYKQELLPTAVEKLQNLNLSNYKDSMQSLIKRDIEKIMKDFKNNKA